MDSEVTDVVIKEIKDSLNDLSRKIDRFFESHIETKTKLGILENNDKDKEHRIRNLETEKNKVLGISIVVGGVLMPIITSVIIALIVNALGG